MTKLRAALIFAVIAILALVYGLVSAGAIQFTLTLPTERTDGTPLLRSDIKETRVYCDSDKTFFLPGGVEAGEAELAPGDHSCYATIVDSDDQESDPSETHSFKVNRARPNPPVNFQFVGVADAAVIVVAPPPSGSGGTISHGDSLVISGSSFGTKTTAAPLVYDDFSGGTDGGSMSSASPVVGSNWGTNVGGSASAPVYDNSRLRSSHSTMASYHNITSAWNSSLTRTVSSTPGDKHYISFWQYVKRTGLSDNTKPYIWYNTSAGEWYLGMGGSGDEGLRHSNQGTTKYGSLSQTNARNKWIRYEIEIENSSSGHYRVWAHFDGAIDEQWNDSSWNGGSGSYSEMQFGAYDTSGGAEIWLDEVYMDTTFQRVEIGNNVVFDSCTRREVQRPTSWGASSITVVANQGELPSSTTLYVFVLDTNGDPISQGANEYVQTVTFN